MIEDRNQDSSSPASVGVEEIAPPVGVGGSAPRALALAQAPRPSDTAASGNVEAVRAIVMEACRRFGSKNASLVADRVADAFAEIVSGLSGKLAEHEAALMQCLGDNERLIEEIEAAERQVEYWKKLDHVHLQGMNDALAAREAAEASVAQLGDALRKALARVAYVPGDHPVVPVKHADFVEAIREALRHPPSADAPSSPGEDR